MSSPALPLTPIANVTVLAGPALGTPPALNQGIIIGPSPRITYANRVAQFSGLAAMLTYGFQITDPEYLLAQAHFSQSPVPQYVWIGLQNSSSLKTMNPHSGNAGTGYAVGDIFLVTQAGGSLGYGQVTSITTGGVVTGIVPVTLQDGTGYTVANGLVATAQAPSVGTGLEVDITAIGETPLVAFTNCRAASPVWYDGLVWSATAADHEAIFAYAQGVNSSVPTFYYGVTSDAGVPLNETTDVASLLKAAMYTQGALIYSTTQGGTAPGNAYAAAALMGSVNGQNTGQPNSYFTEWGKVLVGITPEPLTQAQVNIVNGKNCNVYVGYVDQYELVQSGITPSGVYIDQILNRAILTLSIQYSIMNLLVSVPVVPQTDPGEIQLIHAVNEACQAAVGTGYLAPGTYEGILPVVNLDPGDPMPAGYVSQAAYPWAQAAPSLKSSRQAIPIYTVINEAGAVQSVVVSVLVNL
jgi:hypothetical protein